MYTYEAQQEATRRKEEEERDLYEATRRQEEEERKQKEEVRKEFIKTIIKTIILGILIFIPLYGGWTIIGAGERGVITTFGKVNEKPLNEGIHLKWPIADTIHKISIRVQKHSTRADASSKDLQHVHTEITLNFHLSPILITKIFQNIGNLEMLGEKLITPIIQEAVKASTAHYTAEELVTKRQEVRELIKSYAEERLQNYGIIIDDFSITHFDFSTTFNQAIEAKVTAEQNYLKAERDLERIRVEAAQKIESAKAEAEALRLQKHELTTDLIKLREIEVNKEAIHKWNGQLPQITGGVIPFINIKKE